MARTKIREDAGIEVIESEVIDQQSTPATYKIVTYPADYTLEGLMTQFEKGLMEFPRFQRKFVWTQKQSSRLIESFLLGLPVPAVFLYKDKKEKQHVIDGQQRLRSVYFFVNGTFGEEIRGKQITFRLVGLDDSSPYADKTYAELEATDPSAYHRLNNSVLRSFVVQQLDPQDNSSIFHIFERLNTGGTFLVGQEIRNCVYAGPFNELLLVLNKISDWRAIFGKRTEDIRLRDVELILRFFALLYDISGYTKPMKTFLNNFMGAHRNPSEDDLAAYRDTFATTASRVKTSLGDRPFHLRAGLNAAAFDSVFVAFAHHRGKVPKDIAARYGRLKESKRFVEYITAGTTDKVALQGRMGQARKILFG